MVVYPNWAADARAQRVAHSARRTSEPDTRCLSLCVPSVSRSFYFFIDMSEASVLTLSRFNSWRGRGAEREIQDRQTSAFLGLSKKFSAGYRYLLHVSTVIFH
jgi:hypothetical protein